jgi:agmatine deiminase
MAGLLTTVPRQDGYAMPAEWSPQVGCWMAWPERPDNWRCGAWPAQAAFAEVANVIAEYEPVTMCVSARQYAHARAVLSRAVRVVEMSTNDAWMRDIGPTFVRGRDGTVRAVDWMFNAWGGLAGGLYFPWDADDEVAHKVAEIERVDYYRAPFVLEGGAIHVDGDGTCLTTEECLLNPNRNPRLDRAAIEACLCDYLGVDRVVWLGRGVFGDETDGHIDNLCCFLRPGVVALTWTEDPGDPQAAISTDALARLHEAHDVRGRALEVIKLPQPRTPLAISAAESAGVEPRRGSRSRRAGERLAASYVNFLIVNGAVIVPSFGDANDARAVAILREQFPGRDIRPVPGREILLGGGNVHCITQQQPAAHMPATLLPGG